jgi:hypothetical protein
LTGTVQGTKETEKDSKDSVAAHIGTLLRYLAYAPCRSKDKTNQSETVTLINGMPRFYVRIGSSGRHREITIRTCFASIIPRINPSLLPTCDKAGKVEVALLN